MALESATFINQLVASNPNGADPKGQGDDHLRMIKKVLKSTFPNINAEVSATPAQLNKLTDATIFFVRGMVMMWYGDLSAPPDGWLLCNGQNGTPDLRNRFVVGAGADYVVGQTGGSALHSHTINVGYHTLTEAELPSHVHGTGTLGDNINYTPGKIAAGGPSSFAATTTAAAGGNQGHNHTATSDNADHRPPFYGMGFIMRA